MSIHDKFIDFLEAEGITVESGSFERPFARGSTYWRHFSNQNKKSDKTIFYVHGTGNDHLYGMYELIIGALNLGFNFFSFDLDGHGTNSTTKLSTISSVSMFEDAFHFFRTQWPNEEIHVLSNSAGGQLTLLGLHASKSIKSLCFLGVPFEIDLDKDKIIEEALSIKDSGLWDYIKKWGTDSIPAVGPLGRNRFPVRLEVPQANPFTYVDIIEQICEDVDIPSYMEKLKLDTLCICGENDLIAPADNWERLGLDNVKVSVIPSCNHFTLPINKTAINQYCQWVQDH